jgi:hypothetical protein
MNLIVFVTDCHTGPPTCSQGKVAEVIFGPA